MDVIFINKPGFTYYFTDILDNHIKELKLHNFADVMKVPLRLHLSQSFLVSSLQLCCSNVCFIHRLCYCVQLVSVVISKSVHTYTTLLLQ